MNFLFHVHGWPPVHNAGAEMMAQSIAEGLIARGHSCTVITAHNMLGGPVEGDLNGVKIYCLLDQAKQDQLYGWADVVLTHLDMTAQVVRWAHTAKKPVAHIVHNPWTLSYWEQKPQDIDLLIFNSRWLARDQWPRYPVPGVVCYPPVWRKNYQTGQEGRRPKGERWIGLLNLNENKGGKQFEAIARANPDRLFLGCLGAYDHQVIPHLPNVKLVQHTKDVMQEVYSLCDLLLVPSRVETWGRVAVEAACSGIPVLASTTEGLREAMGRGGIFLDRENTAAWTEQIEKLDDDLLWEQYSKYFAHRAQQLEMDCEFQMDCLEKAMGQLISPDPRRLVGFCSTHDEAYKIRAAYSVVPVANQAPVVCENAAALEACMVWGLCATPSTHYTANAHQSSQARINSLGGPLGKFPLYETHESKVCASRHGMSTPLEILERIPAPRLNQACAMEALENWAMLYWPLIDKALQATDKAFDREAMPVEIVVMTDYQGQEGFVTQGTRLWVRPERGRAMEKACLAAIVRQGLPIAHWPKRYLCPSPKDLPGVTDEETTDPRQKFRRYMARGLSFTLTAPPVPAK